MNKINQLSKLRKKKIKKENTSLGKVSEHIKKINAWLESGNAEDDMRRAFERAEKATKQYRKASEPDWSIIHLPMTIQEQECGLWIAL